MQVVFHREQDCPDIHLIISHRHGTVIQLLRSKNEVFNQLYVSCVTENKAIAVQI